MQTQNKWRGKENINKNQTFSNCDKQKTIVKGQQKYKDLKIGKGIIKNLLEEGKIDESLLCELKVTTNYLKYSFCI